MKPFKAVLTGTDINSYGVARSLHEAYGTKSVAFGAAELLPVRRSAIVECHANPKFRDNDVFVRSLVDYAKQNPDIPLILFAGSEDYIRQIFRNRDALLPYYHIPYFTTDFGISLQDKPNFFKVCDEAGLDYPKSRLIDKDTPDEEMDSFLEFPVVLKPSETSDFFAMHFEGKEKCYIVETPEQLRAIRKRIYDAGYMHPMILQEYVPGDESNEYSVNGYIDPDGNLRALGFGRALFEEPDPTQRGNHLIIAGVHEDERDALIPICKKFVEATGFRGLLNFDFKRDPRNGRFRLFEVNLRQGRSSYYATMAGANLPAIVVDTIVNKTPFEKTVIGDKPFVWVQASPKLCRAHLEGEPADRFDEMAVLGPLSHTMTYEGDSSFFRKLAVKKNLRLLDEELGKPGKEYYNPHRALLTKKRDQ